MRHNTETLLHNMEPLRDPIDLTRKKLARQRATLRRKCIAQRIPSCRTDVFEVNGKQPAPTLLAGKPQAFKFIVFEMINNLGGLGTRPSFLCKSNHEDMCARTGKVHRMSCGYIIW